MLVLAGLAACGSPDDERREPVQTNGGEVTEPEPPRNVFSEAPEPKPETETGQLDRLGQVTIGSTLGDLRKAGLKVMQDGQPMEGSTCSYARVASMPDVFLMLDGTRIVRIDVSGKDHATTGGVRVGQSEAEARRRLGDRVVVQPHPYTGPQGHYLILHDDKSPRGLIVETDGKTVQGYRFGAWEQVQWIEGCS